jgi:hypothetical protein
VELPLTCGPYGCYKISPHLLCSKNTTLKCFSQLWNKIQCKRMKPHSPSNGPIFNIARYPSRGRFLTSSTLNCDRVLDLVESS